MSETRFWRVYGVDGHRQKETFNDSKFYNWSNGNNIRMVTVLNADVTGQNDYSIVQITRNTKRECKRELMGQISDGIFENSRVGKIEEVLCEA